MTTRATARLVAGLLLLAVSGLGQEDFLKVECQVTPRVIAQGQEGTLKIRIVTRSDVRISSYPEFMIRFDENPSLSFAKLFFLGSELNFPTRQENENIFLDLQKEVEIPFRVSDGALTGTRLLSGEIDYTVFFQDNWHVKTFQRFSATFSVRRSNRSKRR